MDANERAAANARATLAADPCDAAIAYATAKGTRAGKAAASWYFDGNTSDATYRATLVRIDNSDIDDFPFADLSGQWADTLTGPELVTGAMLAAHDTSSMDEDAIDALIEGAYHGLDSDICDAYENAFNDAARFEIERVARYHVESATA